MAIESVCLNITPLYPPTLFSPLGTRQSPRTCVILCFFHWSRHWACQWAGREREGEREDVWAGFGWIGESIGLVRTGGEAVCCSWRDWDALILWGLVSSFLSMVFSLTVSLENHEKLDWKVLLVLTNTSMVSSIVREMRWANFQGCWALQLQLKGTTGAQQFFKLGFGVDSPPPPIWWSFSSLWGMFSVLIFSEDSLSHLIILYCLIL